MNDDAKFFFFLSGFLGFSFFYLSSCLLDSDPLLALFKGCLGCLVFGISGRFILGFALKHSLPSSSPNDPVEAGSNSLFDPREEKASNDDVPEVSEGVDQLAVAANLEAAGRSKSVHDLDG